MVSGTLIGYFAERNEAHRSLRELRKRGFRRVALAHRTAHGDVRVWDPFPMRHAFGAVTAFLLFGFVAGIVSLFLHWPATVSSGVRFALFPVLAGGFLGGLFVWFWMRRSRHGIERGLIEDHKRWLTSEETVLILHAPIETLRVAWAVLHDSGGIPPTVFILHPKRRRATVDTLHPEPKASPTRIHDYARGLATEHEVNPRQQSGVALLKQLENTRKWLQQACSDLSEASRMEQRASQTTEWILDNEFVIESNARDVQLNLTRRFVRELPTLANKTWKGVPRVYALAEALVFHSERRLDKDKILDFMEAYQSFQKLTIGELWAVPQMLRIALIGNIEKLATAALTELREREIAGFWANRLITASRRDPNLVFSILAELSEAQPAPSAYLATQLVDHLYDEEAALAPVRGWLERTLKESLSGLNHREQNRQTKDQIAISNVFQSLRQLALLDWKPIFERLSHTEQLLRTDPAGVYPQTDFDTRDRCRRKVEELSRRSGRTEAEVAQCAIELAASAASRTTPDERRIHVGTYLIGEGKHELSERIGCTEYPRHRFLDCVRRHHSAVYFNGILFFCVAIMSPICLIGLSGQTPRGPIGDRPPLVDPRQSTCDRDAELPPHTDTSRTDPSENGLRHIGRSRFLPNAGRCPTASDGREVNPGGGGEDCKSGTWRIKKTTFYSVCSRTTPIPIESVARGTKAFCASPLRASMLLTVAMGPDASFSSIASECGVNARASSSAGSASAASWRSLMA